MKGFALALLAPAVVSAMEGLSHLTWSKEEYRSGAVHEALMEVKMATWQREESLGLFDQSAYPPIQRAVPCVNGRAVAQPGNANQTFQCNNIDLKSFLSHASLGSNIGQGSSSWGWTAPNGREFAAIGQGDGCAFAEILKDGRLVYLGRLPQQSVPSQWREIRSFKNYMIIGSEAVGHGVQIFDMRKLLTVNPKSPKVFSTVTDLTALWNELPIGRTHNVVANEERDYIVAVGAAPRNSTCAAGLIFVDMKDPSKPKSPGCAAQDGYVHDAQCLVYHGPDKRYEGRDICYGYNEDTLTIYDVTNKTGMGTAAKIISRTTYTGARYTHQGWVLDPKWQQYLVLDDELDEEFRVGPAADGFPVTYIFDISNLEAPKNTGFYKSKVQSIDHNQYIFDGLSYQSNYGAGLRVLDVSSIPKDPSGASVNEVAFFDIYPEDDAKPLVDFIGTWSHFAGYPSGNILVNTIERGAFVVKMSKFKGKGRGKHWRKPRESSALFSWF